MAERRHTPHRHQQQQLRPAVLDVDLISDFELEQNEMFTPDDEYFTPPTTTTAAAAATSQASAHSQSEYKPRTVKAFDKARAAILPTFPPRSTLRPMNRSTTITTTTFRATNVSEEEPDFLLCNVPSKIFMSIDSSIYFLSVQRAITHHGTVLPSSTECLY